MRCLKAISILFLMLCSSANGWSQERVAVGRIYERLLAVVPMIGAGTYEDPQRPAYVPDYLLPGRAAAQLDTTSDPFDTAREKGEAPKVIIRFSYVLSDDSRFALVEFQATDRSAFRTLSQAARNPGGSSEPGANRNALEGGFDLKVFEIGRAKRDDVETEFRKHRRDFDLDLFLAGNLAQAASANQSQ